MALEPERTTITRIIRDLAFKELVNTMKLKLTPECKEDLVLVAGDFNVFRYNIVDS